MEHKKRDDLADTFLMNIYQLQIDKKQIFCFYLNNKFTLNIISRNIPINNFFFGNNGIA